MPLRALWNGPGEAVPPLPEEDFLRFNFELWGSVAAPDEELSEIRGFLGFSIPGGIGDATVWDPSINDFTPVIHRRSFRRLPSRNNAPPDVDRANPPPAWFDQGFPIEQTGPPTMVTFGAAPIITTPYTVVVPESALPGWPFPPSLSLITGNDLRLVLLQLVGRTTGRKKWFRDVHSLGAVSTVNVRDRIGPWVRMTTRGWNFYFGLGAINSPVTFSGTVVDQPIQGSGISGAFLNIYDRGSIPERVYDFQQSIWRAVPQAADAPLEPGSHLNLDLDFVDPFNATFSTRWHEPGDGSGLYEARVHALDKRGHEFSSRWWFHIDNEAPELLLDVPGPNQTIIGPEAFIEARVNDNIALLRSIRLQIADNHTKLYWNDALSAWDPAPTTFLKPFEREGAWYVIRYRWTPGVESGHFAIRLQAEDAAGNTQSVARTMHYANADTIAPIVQIQRPANGSTHPSGSVTISGRVLDNVQVENLVLFIQRVDMPNPTPNYVPTVPLTPGPRGWHTWSHTLDIAELQGPGSYRVIAYAQDAFENEGEAEKVFHLGMTTPA